MALTMRVIVLGCLAAVACVEGFRLSSPTSFRRRSNIISRPALGMVAGISDADTISLGSGGGSMIRAVPISVSRQRILRRRAGYGSHGIFFGGDSPDLPDLPSLGDFDYYGLGGLGGLSSLGSLRPTSRFSYNAHRLLEDIDSNVFFG